MTDYEIPQVPTNPTNDPKPQNPPPERKIGDAPKPREVTSFKVVGGLPLPEPKHGEGERASRSGEVGFDTLPDWSPLAETPAE